ncbi:hypothetical protein E1301_Tti003554 [Triplophysa tibetana]|uniref:EGF-like domain-containing protein n=1 Tax=Triplophysa tibetana TaxID=1572043 RepID=A0A5A9PTG1_9TELE|nr:hypothetical protein E1301_Tti003554 [Triplophysa tibetana]
MNADLTLFIVFCSFGFIYSKSSPPSCPSGQFLLKNQCVLCHPTCAECDGHELFECTACGLDEDGKERFLYQGHCRLHCPREFYPDRDQYTCLPCMPNCEICVDTNVCAKCREGYKLQIGVCLTVLCGVGQVQDPDTRECLDCGIGCKTCSTDDSEVCNSCMDGYYLFMQSFEASRRDSVLTTEGRLCDTTSGCGVHQISFLVKSQSRLPEIHAVRHRGTSYELTPQLTQYRHQCRQHCPQRTYEDRGRGLCMSCVEPCLDCRSDALCLTCQHGYFLNNGSCVKECSPDTYKDTRAWRCQPCHSSCLTCHGPGVRDCDRCSGWSRPVYGKCPVITCPEGQYVDGESRTCLYCDPSCRTCYGPRAQNCITCATGYMLEAQDVICVDRCPLGFYGNSSSLICERCSANCVACESRDECVSCNTASYQLYLFQGGCYSNCPDGYFESELGTCEACDGLCLTCDGTSTQCLSCRESLHLASGQCRQNCAPMSYVGEDGACKRCAPHCDSCASSDTCTRCSFLYLLLNGECKAVCPKGYFEDLDQGICVNCHPTCATCSGPLSDDCETCDPLTPKLYEGTYYSAGERCERCDRSCEQCTGPGPDTCRVCTPPLLDLQGTRQCVEQCPQRFYENGHRCTQCHTSCQSCTALCVEAPIQNENQNEMVHRSKAIQHTSAALPAALLLAVVLALVVFGLIQARAKKRYCWRRSYERLSGVATAQPNNRPMPHGVPLPDDSGDEADVVYTSRDGSVYRRYGFIPEPDTEEEQDEDEVNENTHLNRA